MKKFNFLKKITMFVLCLIIVLGIMPMTVLADGTYTFPSLSQSGDNNSPLRDYLTDENSGNVIVEQYNNHSGLYLNLDDGDGATLYAQLDETSDIASDYIVYFDANGGDKLESITVTDGEKYGRLPSSAITGLSGGDSNWYLVDENGNLTETKITRNSTVDTKRDHTLFVKRKVLAPTLKISLEVPGAISDGYQYYVPNNSKRILTVTINNQNTEVIDYTYQWYKNGAVVDGATQAILTLEGNVSDAGTYKVKVTATLKDGTGIIVTSDTASAEKEQVVKIMHASNTLYYDANGGEGGPSSNYTGGIDITVQTNEPTREGYIFSGWNTKADGTGESYDGGATYTFANDNGNGGCTMTLYAQWIKAYGVYVGGVQIIETNKDDVLGDGKVSYDAKTSTLTLKDANITNGYEYTKDCIAGIYAEGDLNIELISTENTVTAPDSKKTSYGICVLGNLNVSGDGAALICGIYSEGGIAISDKLIIELPENGEVGGVGGSSDYENQSKPDYWTILDSEGEEARNIIIKPLIYNVYLKGLSYDMAVTVSVGKSVNATYCELYEVDDFSERLNTNKDGYTFGGWYTDEACTEGNEFSFDDPVSADITIYAKWVSVAADDDTEEEDNKPSDKTPSDDTSPKTGDNSHTALWNALLLVSGAVSLGITLIDRKRKAASKR